MHKAKKSLGQHFLMHPRIAERIALAAELTPDDTVFEIGPGKGMLTKALLAKCRVVALETDRELCAALRLTYAEEIKEGRLSLLEGDVQYFDPEQLPKRYKIVANIPYYLTGSIVRTFLSAKHQPLSMTLLVQKEVAARIARAKKETLLSLSVKVYGVPSYICTVSKGSFVPAPKVDSAVLHIAHISRKHFQTESEEDRFFALIHAGFAHKRKLLRNNLAELKVTLPDALITKRAEDLTLEDWLNLARS
jgi:16S rRNA (adenine1518-N6/adenine1519-N6)-dimethyltransferase